MATSSERFQAEDGFITAVLDPLTPPPFADLVAERPGADYAPTSHALFPQRAEVMVAAHNAFVGHDSSDFVQLVADAQAFRYFCQTKEKLAEMRELFETREIENEQVNTIA